MPVCPICGSACKDGASFCTECGTKLIKPEEIKPQAPVIPEPETIETPEPAPVPEQPAPEPPVFEQPAQPVFEQPAPPPAPEQPSWQERYQQQRPQFDQTQYQQQQQQYQQQYQQYQQQYQQPYQQYQQPAAEKAEAVPADSGEGKASGIVSLVFGILGMLCCLCPIFSVVGLITGIVSLTKKRRGVAIAGLILSIIALLLFIASIVISVIFWNQFLDWVEITYPDIYDAVAKFFTF